MTFASTRNLVRQLGGNTKLARLLVAAIRTGLDRPWVMLSAKRSVDAVMSEVMATSTRNLNTHPKGRLLRRFLEHGPLDEDADFDDSVPSETDTRTDAPLSDVEAAEVMEFLHSVSVNRFKGEVAELLALTPAVQFIEGHFGDLVGQGRVQLWWGDTVRQAPLGATGQAGHLKGADGVALEIPASSGAPRVLAVFEIKSNYTSPRDLSNQLRAHVLRMNEGMWVLDGKSPARKHIPLDTGGGGREPAMVAILPSRKRLSRSYQWLEAHPGSNRKVLPVAHSIALPPQLPASRMNGMFRIVLPASVEHLEEAAYWMTFLYVERAASTIQAGQGGTGSPGSAGLGGEWQDRIKHHLMCLGLRPLSDRLRWIVAKFFNVYCYSYALGIDSRVLLWPEDIPDLVPGEVGTIPAIHRWRGPRTFEFDLTKGWGRWVVLPEGGREDVWIASRVVTGLASHLKYDVAFHVGLAFAVPVWAGAGMVGIPSVWTQLEPQGPELLKRPSPFPRDPAILRCGFGKMQATADGKGHVELSFRFKAARDLWQSELVRTLIGAFDPAREDQESIDHE